MTSGQESSDRPADALPVANLESLAGVFHPHAIEVQDFSHYALVIDVRPRAAYEEDHIPGAVHVEPVDAVTGVHATGSTQPAPGGAGIAEHSVAPMALSSALASLVAPVKLDQAILVYCGRGGLDSLPVAKALRWRGWTVDVLPGGWINYRRWVQAGLEMLPRLIAFRVIAASLGTEKRRVLHALGAHGHQVVDVDQMAGWRHGPRPARPDPQPAQARFESLLLQALRAVDPRLPVWVGDFDHDLGSLRAPGALMDAVAIAPTACLEVPLAERVACWREDEPALHASPEALLDAVAASSPPPDPGLLARWRELATQCLTELATSVLRDHFDVSWRQRVAARQGRAHTLKPLVCESLSPRDLAAVVGGWAPVRNRAD